MSSDNRNSLISSFHIFPLLTKIRLWAVFTHNSPDNKCVGFFSTSTNSCNTNWVSCDSIQFRHKPPGFSIDPTGCRLSPTGLSPHNPQSPMLVTSPRLPCALLTNQPQIGGFHDPLSGLVIC